MEIDEAEDSVCELRKDGTISPYEKVDREQMASPTLEDIMKGHAFGEINKDTFLKYLGDIHSTENFEFVVCVEEYLREAEHHAQMRMWDIIRKNFIHEDGQKEINLSFKVKDELLRAVDKLPDRDYVLNALNSTYEILLDLFAEFSKENKVHSQSTRRKSDSILIEPVTKYGIQKRLSRSPEPKKQSNYTPVSSSSTESQITSMSKSRKTRGTSFGNMMESLVSSDIRSLKNTVKKFNRRRFSNEDVVS